MGAFGCDPEWGHAVSTDLLHWQHLPPALTPGTTGPDRNGCWSGCTVIADGVPTILYSGLVRKSLALEDRVWCLSQCLATGSEDLVHWRKHPGNPILADPPEEFRGRLNAWHDPHVWRERSEPHSKSEGDTWYMLLGGAYKDGSAGLTFLYRSADLTTWEYLHPFCEGTVPGERWLVPDFFPSGDRHVMLFSDGSTFALIGDYRDHRFLARRRQLVDHGPQFDSARTLHDASGRHLLFGWIREDRPTDAVLQAGWAGMMSLPRALSVEDDELRIDVPPEVRAATAPDAEIAGVDLAPGAGYRIDGADGDCLEVEMEIEVRDAASVGLTLCRSRDGEEQTTIAWHRDEAVLRLDRTHSSLDPDVGRGVHDAPLALAPGEPLTLTVFLDRSVVEVFANRRAALTGRIYPTRPDSTGVELFGTAGSAEVRRCRVWHRISIW